MIKYICVCKKNLEERFFFFKLKKIKKIKTWKRYVFLRFKKIENVLKRNFLVFFNLQNVTKTLISGVVDSSTMIFSVTFEAQTSTKV